MKKIKSSITVTGLSIRDIMNMDLSNLSLTDTRKLATRLMSASNKRLKRLEQSGTEGITSYMYQKIKEGHKTARFSVKAKKGEDKRQQLAKLRNQVKEMREFLSSKSSTLRGWKKIKKNVSDRLSDELGENINLTNAEYDQLWRVYGLIMEVRTSDVLRRLIGNSPEIQALAYEIMNKTKGMDAEEKREYINQVLNDLEEQGNQDNGGTEDGFTIEGEEDLPF